MNNTSKIVLDSREMDWALTRMAHEIIEQNKGIEDLALIGIRTGGVPCVPIDILVWNLKAAMKYLTKNKGDPI